MQYNKPDLESSVHGNINPGEMSTLGLDPAKVIDFSANINPLGISPKVKKALSDMKLDGYPDPDCLELRQALSLNTGVAAANIITGNGSTELIHLLGRACLTSDSHALILAPTFGEYETACRLAGVKPLFLNTRDNDGFTWDLSNVCQRLEEIKPQLVFLCNPNNPTGLYLDKAAVQQIAAAATTGLLIIDQAYLPFVEKPWDSRDLLDSGNVVLLRSMTKDYGMAGLRLGYALAPEKLIETMKLYQPCWSVNTAAQAAGLAALADREHVDRARKIITESKAYLYTALNELEIETVRSSVNFLMARTGNAPSVRLQLLKQNLCVRDCTSFGLPHHIRISLRTMPECRKLVEGLKRISND